MLWNPFLQNNNQLYSSPRTPGEYEKSKPSKLLLIVVGVIATTVIVVLIARFLQPESQQSKYIKSATVAARKITPNAKVSDLKVAGGFALASVSSPTANGQGKSGNLTIFRVNKDGSMTQIAVGSSFGPVDLLELGIPLASQAQLTESSVVQVKQNLANQCGYDGGSTPGYRSFGGSFNPGGWQIDAAALDGLEQALTAAISNKNAGVKSGEKVICVNATREKSSATTDKQTYISTFSLELQFITGNGAISTHMFTYTLGPNYYRSYTLDGQKIPNR